MKTILLVLCMNCAYGEATPQEQQSYGLSKPNSNDQDAGVDNLGLGYNENDGVPLGCVPEYANSNGQVHLFYACPSGMFESWKWSVDPYEVKDKK